MRRLTFIWQIMGWVFSFYLDSCILHVNHPCPLSFLFSCGPFDPAHSIYVGVSPFYSLWLRRDCTLAHLFFFFFFFNGKYVCGFSFFFLWFFIFCLLDNLFFFFFFFDWDIWLFFTAKECKCTVSQVFESLIDYWTGNTVYLCMIDLLGLLC